MVNTDMAETESYYYEMAERLSVEVNRSSSDASDEEDVLKDSLESDEHSLSSGMVADEQKPVEGMEDTNDKEAIIHIPKTLPKQPVQYTEAPQKVRESNDNRTNRLPKSTQRDIIELNKTNLSKGRPKMSYSKMYQKRVQGQRTSKKPEENGQKLQTRLRPDEPDNLTKQAAKDIISGIHGQVYGMDGMLNGDDPCVNDLPPSNLVTSGHPQPHVNEKFHENLEHDFNVGRLGRKTEWGISNQFKGNHSQFSDNALPVSNMVYSNNPNYYRDMNDMYCGNKFYKEQDVNTRLHLGDICGNQNLPAISEVPTSVRSAPADIQTFYQSGNPQYEIPCDRPSSLCTLKAKDKPTISKDDKTKATGYSSIYAKQHSVTYEPYTLNDYRRLKQSSNTSSGGLGPNTNSEEFKQKMEKTARQKEYAAFVRQKHSLDKKQWKKAPILSNQPRSLKIQEADDKRKKALQYAKAVPKPTTIRRQSPPRKTEINHQEPRTLLDILRQRHENERKAIDAVRKDLEAKLKIR